MTPQQEARERRSIEDFVDTTVNQVRPKGTNAAVTLVIIAAARAAAEASVRKRSGAIDKKEAATIFFEATRLMTWFK
jgi:hypothetical protein